MIELKGISKTYQSKGVKVEALRGVTLTLPERGMVFVVGKSGSGKSTLLNILGGLDSPTSGEMLVDGISVKEFRSRDYDAYRNDYVGFVFQEYNLIDSLTVEENVELALNLRGEKDAKAVGEVLDRVELSGYGTRKISSLSGGQKQRVAIARALIKRPRLLIADEPTGALDSETGNSLFRLLKELSKEVLVVVVSHDLDFAHTYGDRIVELADGRVIADSGEEKEVAAPRRAVFDRKKPLTVGKAIKLGLKGVRKNPVRFAISIVLCSISLLMFGVGAMMSQYDHDRVLGETLLAYDDGIILSSSNRFLTETEFKEIAEQYPGISFKPIYSGLSGKKDVNDYDLVNGLELAELPQVYYNVEVNSFCELSEEELREKGYSLTAGRMPVEDGEVAVPLYLYEKLAELTAQGLSSDLVVETSEDLLNKVLGTANAQYLTITGIVDTKIDPKYQILKEFTGTEADEELLSLSEEFFEMAEDSIQFSCFLSEGYFDRHLQGGIVYVYNYWDSLAYYSDPGGGLPQREYPYEYFIAAGDLSDGDWEDIYAPGLSDRTLREDEVLVSFRVLLAGSPAVNELYRQKRREIIDSYTEEQINALYEDPAFCAEFETETISRGQVIVNYSNSLFDRYYDLNPYGKSGKELEREAQRAIFDGLQENLSSFQIFDREANEEYIAVNKKLVGIFYGDNVPIRISLSDPVYTARFAPYKERTIKAIYADPSGCGIDEFKAFVREFETGEDVSPSFDNHIVGKMLPLDNFASVFEGFGFLLGGVFTVFAVLMIFNFISSNVKDRKSEIGILRALGAGTADTVRIFMIEALFISLLTFGITLILLLIATPVFNNVFVSVVDLAMKVVSVNAVVLFSIMGISLCSALLGFLIPLIHIVRLKPIDAIRK